MHLSDRISKLRTDAALSQEKFAELLNVSRQTVQKWESGSVQPDAANLIAIAIKFGISLDALVFDSDARIVEELPYDRKLLPQYSLLHSYEVYSSNLTNEYRQSIDEGKDISAYKDLFTTVEKLPLGKYKEQIADILFDIVLNAPTVPGYPYREPSDVNEIRSLRKPYTFARRELTKEELTDKIRGAWFGRICGCLLGIPVEGMRTNELVPFLTESGNYPMHRYILSTDVTDEVREKYTYRISPRAFVDRMSHTPWDDDTNYTVLAQVIVEQYTRDFTPYDVSRAWLKYQPKDSYCTAERVAFCNFVKGYIPPDSAEYKNCAREWIGAQIRGDYFGYINPGNPELAADMAWRDASISHVKNGIYGEMYVAAMLACAAVTDSIEDIICGGLAEIPATSRLYEAVSTLLCAYHSGVDQKACFASIHEKYDEHKRYEYIHTITNALVVTASLLYGKGDYGKSVCMAVETGYDTDCNAATVGSILGMRGGYGCIGEEWTKPVGGKLDTTIFGIGTLAIDEAVERTIKHVK